MVINTRAQYQTGLMYYFEKGVSCDHEQAI